MYESETYTMISQAFISWPSAANGVRRLSHLERPPCTKYMYAVIAVLSPWFHDQSAQPFSQYPVYVGIVWHASTLFTPHSQRRLTALQRLAQ